MKPKLISLFSSWSLKVFRQLLLLMMMERWEDKHWRPPTIPEAVAWGSNKFPRRQNFSPWFSEEWRRPTWRWPSSSLRLGNGLRGTRPPSAPAALRSAKNRHAAHTHRGPIKRLGRKEAGQFTSVVQGSGLFLGRWWQKAAIHRLQRRHQGEAEGLALTSGAVADGAAGGVNLSDLHLPPKDKPSC